MTCYIYQALNRINGKLYIGFTTQDLQKRIAQHLYGSKCIFHRALRKYGIENFEWSILYETEDEDYCLNVMEPYFIKEIRTKIPRGYNISDGGNRGPRLPGKLNPMYGQTHTEEAKAKCRESGKKSKDKSYEQRYGNEKAAELRQLRSDQRKQYLSDNPPVGESNSNYDSTSYNFVCTNGTIFQGTMYDFRQQYPEMTKVNTHRIKNGGGSKGWKLKLAKNVD